MNPVDTEVDKRRDEMEKLKVGKQIIIIFIQNLNFILMIQASFIHCFFFVEDLLLST